MRSIIYASTMRPAERFELLRDIAGYLASMSKAEVDMIFRESGSPLVVMPGGWDGSYEGDRKDAALTILSEQTDEFLEAILEFKSETERRRNSAALALA